MKGFAPFVSSFLLCFFLTIATTTVAQSELETLYKSAKECSEINNQIQKADSISQEAVSRAKASLNDDLLYESLMAYLTRDQFGFLTRLPEKYLDMAVDLADEITNQEKKFDFWVVLSEQLLYQSNLNKGTELARRALSYAASTTNPKIKAMAYIASARAAMATNRVKEAWQNLLNAQNFIASIEAKNRRKYELILSDELIDFHQSINNYKKAQELTQKKMQDILNHEPVDSVSYMWTILHLSILITSNESDIRIDSKIKSLLNFAKRTNNKTLLHYTSALNRNYLINNLKLSEFHTQYVDKYDLRLAELEKPEEEAAYCLSNALFCEYKSRIDSAQTLYKRALVAAQKTKNEFRIANYHRRYGEFLLRHEMNDEAYEQLYESLKLSEKNKNYVDVLEVVDPLDSLAKFFGDYKAAYNFADIKLKANSYLSFQQEKENLLIMELENEREQNELRQKEAYEAEKKKFNLQYFAIGIGLTTFFLILMIVSSMAVPGWLIDMLGFFSILFIFEFVILILDHKIHHWAHGEPLKIFFVKIIILSVLYPIHHVIEHSVTTYMKKALVSITWHLK